VWTNASATEAARRTGTQDQPQLRLVLTPAKGDPVTWTISKPKIGGYYVVQVSAKPWFLQLKDDSARPVLEASGREKLFASAPARNALASRNSAGPSRGLTPSP
jgi:hypothetical protein